MTQPGFFARQASARRHTVWLEFYFGLAVIGTIALTFAAVAIFLRCEGMNPFQPKVILAIVMVTVIIIANAAFYKFSQLSDGGRAVAQMFSGRPILPNTPDSDERRLLNVVEEIAIASGIAVPQVFVLPAETGINAFAAGHSTRDAVICVTPAALKGLTRDELQGVIGHEFSHILNGDMTLNLRLMGWVFGLLCLAICGRFLLQTRGRKNPLPLLGLLLIVAGSVGVFFASLIKSAVNREREYLADASAVQFTRNPMGLANALKKVGSVGSRMIDINAKEASHLFFANGIVESFANLYATHPPLEKRILALDPMWDGKFIRVDLAALRPKVEEPKPTSGINYMEQTGHAQTIRSIRPVQMGTILGATSGPATLANAALRLPHAQLSYAADWRAKLSPALAEAARDPMSAVALIYALLLGRDNALRAEQLAKLQTQSSAGICDEIAKLFPIVAELESTSRLPLTSLTMTALRRLSPAQYAEFAGNIQYIIESDQQLELFEYALQKIVLRQLESNFKPVKKMIVQYYVLKPLLPDCAVLLSAVAYAGQSEPAQVESAFQQGAAKLNAPELALLAPDDCNFSKVDVALDRLNLSVPHLKTMALAACAETVAADGVIQETEAELLRAIADTLECPIPPFLHLE